ncbi:hypothetical protein CIG75_09690 [Tumebacillus algifaecis]|uniref:Uncharacterized protein n=1 Tax=Tumebacillus algifaecis TaxID=1214604 RepID=A0A223D1L3_9BACL|nr:hypothetical protein [Tumebacillus algifaecis]ASS75226.1 hypothetical protein CIG75_09690 [Tumebacillus algifaecis]
MQTVLIVLSYLLLLLSVLSFWQTFKQKPAGFFHELEAAGMSNGVRQIMYAITGLYLLYVLTVMNVARPLTWFGIVTIIESLCFLLALRGDLTSGLFVRWYRYSVGMYVSAVFHILFPIVALYFLQFS